MENNELLDHIFKKPNDSRTLGSPAQNQETPIHVIDREIVNLPISDIQFVDSVFDYDPSESIYTAVCRTNNGLFCIDNPHKINAAQAAGNSEVRCEVDTLSRHSDTDIMIRKTTRRIMPAGGRAPFFQIAVNLRNCFNELSSTTEGLILFGQGGDRLSAKFTGDRQNDVRIILQVRCGRNRDTINGYLSATDYLDQETQIFLFQQKATKAFCDAIRKEKTNLINSLQSQRLNQQIIIDQVSTAVKAWFIEFENNGTITQDTTNKTTAAKPSATVTAAATPSAVLNTAVPSKRSKKTATPPSLQLQQSSPSGGTAPVAAAATIALAEELYKNGNELIALAETMKGVTDAGLKGAFYFDFMVAKNSVEEIFSRISKHFDFDEKPESNAAVVH